MISQTKEENKPERKKIEKFRENTKCLEAGKKEKEG